MNIFQQFPNQTHIGEIFTPEEYVKKTVQYLNKLVKPSKNVTIIDPCAGLGQFEYYLQNYFVIANEIDNDNFMYLQDNIPVDIANNVDSLKYDIPTGITAVIANPPYSGHINNKKAKRSEMWMQFIEKYFLNSNIPLALFIVPCKWMTNSKLYTTLAKYIYFVEILDSSKFLLKKSKWSNKSGISARIMSGTCLLILSKTCPEKFILVREDIAETIYKSDMINILPVNLQHDTITACKYINKFVELTSKFGCILDRFMSQYHFELHSSSNHFESHCDLNHFESHNELTTSNEITECSIYQSRRKRLLNKKVDPSQFRINSHFNDYKCIVATSNECWNGYTHNFPATVLDPKMVYTSNYIGFWGSKEECTTFKQLFQSKEFNILLCMIKQTQNFNSNYLWCTPLVTSESMFDIFTKGLNEFKDFMNAFDSEHKRSYDRSNFYDE